MLADQICSQSGAHSKQAGLQDKAGWNQLKGDRKGLVSSCQSNATTPVKKLSARDFRDSPSWAQYRHLLTCNLKHLVAVVAAFVTTLKHTLSR